jgi:hypothetical protein
MVFVSWNAGKKHRIHCNDIVLFSSQQFCFVDAVKIYYIASEWILVKIFKEMQHIFDALMCKVTRFILEIFFL